MPMTFWGGWAAGIATIGLLWLAWWSVSVYRAKPDEIAAPPDVWDDNLTEGNAEPPKWWFFSLFASLIFSACYVMLYPGFGDSLGLLSWSQHTQFENGIKHYRSRTADTKARWESAPLAELAADESAMGSARRLFASNCSGCHGADAAGQAGMFPDLTDNIWHWGDSEDIILQTISKGRIAAMPPWLAVVGKTGVEQVADYVIALRNGEQIGSEHDAGRAVYDTNCVACHGASGEGNPALGSPAFRGHKWMYVEEGQNERLAVIDIIANGRDGHMPAHEGRLTQSQIRVLAAWVTGGMELAPPR